VNSKATVKNGKNIGEQRAYVAENVILRRIIRRLLDTLSEVLNHAPNLATWAASYHIYKQYDKKRKFQRLSKDEKYMMYATRYSKVLSAIEDATMYLEGNKIMANIVVDADMKHES